MYLPAPQQKILAELLLSPLWADVERCLRERRPESPDLKDPSHVAAAKGHQRAGFEKCLEELKKLPKEEATVHQSPFERPAVLNTED